MLKVTHFIHDGNSSADNSMLDDSQALQATVQRIHTYVAGLEEKVDALQKKKS